MRRLKYLHELPDWPDFTFRGEALASLLAAVRHRQGRLLGQMAGLGFELQSETSLTTLTTDVVKSSAIEGEKLNPDQVRSARLGLDAGGLPPAGRDLEGTRRTGSADSCRSARVLHPITELHVPAHAAAAARSHSASASPSKRRGLAGSPTKAEW